MDERLMPCPKCGGEAEIISHYIKGVANRIHTFVRCKECRYRPHNEYRETDKAIEKWNLLKDRVPIECYEQFGTDEKPEEFPCDNCEWNTNNCCNYPQTDIDCCVLGSKQIKRED